MKQENARSKHKHSTHSWQFTWIWPALKQRGKLVGYGIVIYFQFSLSAAVAPVS